MKKHTKVKVRNLVQKHVQEFCTPTTFADRKKKAKAGYVKHKGLASLE